MEGRVRGHMDWDKTGEFLVGFIPFLRPSVMTFSARTWKCAFFLFLRPHHSGSHAIKVLLACHHKKNGVINEGCRQLLLQVLHVRKKNVWATDQGFSFSAVGHLCLWEAGNEWRIERQWLSFPASRLTPLCTIRQGRQPKHTGGKVEVVLRMQHWGCLLLTPALLEER